MCLRTLTSHQPNVEPKNNVRTKHVTKYVTNHWHTKKPAVARELNANTQRQQSTMKSIVRRHPSSSLESSFASSRSRRDPCFHCITQQHDKHGEQTVLHPRNEGFTPSTWGPRRACLGADPWSASKHALLLRLQPFFLGSADGSSAVKYRPHFKQNPVNLNYSLSENTTI